MSENETYLAHHGILGQKWGVRRYQNMDGSLTELGRKHRGLSGKSSKSKSKGSELKNAVEKVRTAQAQRKAEKAKLQAAARKKAQRQAAEQRAKNAVEKHERLKMQIRKHPKDLYKYKNEFTRDEVKELIDQIEWDRKIADIKFDEYRRFNSRAKEVANSVTTMSTIMNQGVSLYNNTALIYNAMIDHQIQSGALSSEHARKASKLDWSGNQSNDKKDK